MALGIRTIRALTPEEIKAIEEYTDSKMVAKSIDFERNKPPSFPLFKSLQPNYELGDELDDEHEDYDFNLQIQENYGHALETLYPCIVHTYAY